MPNALQSMRPGVPGGGYRAAFLNGAAATNDQEVVAADAATPNRRIIVHAVFVTMGVAAGSIFFESGTATAISPTINIPINGPVLLDFNPAGWFSTNRGESLTVSSVGAGALPGILVVYTVQ